MPFWTNYRRIEKSVTQRLQSSAGGWTRFNQEKTTSDSEIQYTLCIGQSGTWEFQVRCVSANIFLVYTSDIKARETVTWEILASFVPLPLLCGAYYTPGEIPRVFLGHPYDPVRTIRLSHSYSNVFSFNIPTIEAARGGWNLLSWSIKDDRLTHSDLYRYDGTHESVRIDAMNFVMLRKGLSPGVALYTLLLDSITRQTLPTRHRHPADQILELRSGRIISSDTY